MTSIGNKRPEHLKTISDVKSHRDSEMASLELTSEQMAFVNQIPTIYKLAHGRALKKKVPLGKAVKSKCLDCACWVKEEVEKCIVDTCPLYQYRPYK